MTETLDKDAYIAAVRADGQALVAAARVGLDAPVPSCPGWSLTDLTGHVGRVYRSVSEHLERRSLEMVPASEIESAPRDASVIAYFEAGHARVLDALGDTDPDEPIWTWSADGTAGFYQRRMAQETLVHRWDAENAHGTVGPIDGDLAADGVSELYDVIAPLAIENGDKPHPEGSLHLHRTDGEGEWMLQIVDGHLVATHEHAKGDAAVRATGADLLLLVWGRLALEDAEAEVFGDADVADAWLHISR